MGSSSAARASTTKKRATRNAPTQKAAIKKSSIRKPTTRQSIVEKAATTKPTHGTSAKLRRKAAEAKPLYSLFRINDNNEGDMTYKSDNEDLGSESEDLSAESDAQDGASDDSKSSSSGGYGDLEDTGGSYKVIMEMEVTLEDHERLCGCGLSSKTSRCRRTARARKSAR